MNIDLPQVRDQIVVHEYLGQRSYQPYFRCECLKCGEWWESPGSALTARAWEKPCPKCTKQESGRQWNGTRRRQREKEAAESEREWGRYWDHVIFQLMRGKMT